MPRDQKYYQSKLLALRNAIDVLLTEMEQEPCTPSQRKRRNLKESRTIMFDMAFQSGTWSKPAELKKTKKQKRA
jgi:hypothetical protein